MSTCLPTGKDVKYQFNIVPPLTHSPFAQRSPGRLPMALCTGSRSRLSMCAAFTGSAANAIRPATMNEQGCSRAFSLGARDFNLAKGAETKETVQSSLIPSEVQHSRGARFQQI